MKKNILNILGVGLLAATVLTGCSSGDKVPVGTNESENEVSDSVEQITVEEETEITTDEKVMSASELEAALSTQPVCVISTKYVVQNEQYKSLYPDMLNAVIKNNSGSEVKNAVVAFVAWDSNNLPVKIQGQYDYEGGTYVKQCNYNDANMIDGATFGENGGYSLSAQGAKIATFKAIVVSYTDFDGQVWENPLYNDWCELYEDKKLEAA